jgi:hypothetical protein
LVPIAIQHAALAVGESRQAQAPSNMRFPSLAEFGAQILAQIGVQEWYEVLNQSSWW